MSIYRISIAGADDAVRPETLAALSDRFPFVEWGILFSRPETVRERYPSLDWIRELTAISRRRATNQPTNQPLNLSLHLCARAAQKTIRGDWEAQSEYRDIFADFQRFQLNADYAKSRKYLPNLPSALRELSPSGQFIVQLTGEPLNEEVAQNLAAAGLDVAFLFDGSGGWGKTPESWRAAEGCNCGYAGGLNPENLEATLPQIEAAAGDARVYLDLESGARDADNRFDLAKVERILEIVAPRVAA